jgi:hypothetical protein
MKEVTAKFEVNIVGENSGNPYSGEFEVRTLITMRQQAAADESRRMILGFNPDQADGGIKNLAFTAGQLSVRVKEGPEWWSSAGLGGIDLPDANVLIDLLNLCGEAEQERKNKIIKESKSAESSIKASDEAKAKKK